MTSSVRVAKLAEAAGQHAQELWDKCTSSTAVDSDVLAGGASLLVLAAGHAHALQFQEASVGFGSVGDAVGLAKQIAGHLQMLAGKAAVGATADATLVGNVEMYAGLVEGHVRSLLGRCRKAWGMGPAALAAAGGAGAGGGVAGVMDDPGLALVSVQVAAHAAFYGSLLQFQAAAKAKVSREVLAGLVPRVESGSVFDDDCVTRAEELEAQAKMHAPAAAAGAGAGGRGAGGGVGGALLALGREATVKVAADGARLGAKAASLASRLVTRTIAT
ncbi:hypothetical protein CLOM_g7497, partial [Closterium sp. NIES-68]